MSIDLVVWEGPLPATDDEARATLDALDARFLDGPRTAPTERIAEYVRVLLARYPDIPSVDDEDTDEVPWGSGPLIGNASGPIVYIDMKLNTVVEEGWRFCVETARSHGLVAFDPQAATLATPNLTVASVPYTPSEERRGGPVYRWVSLRTWRWPFLRPLVRLLRRFL